MTRIRTIIALAFANPRDAAAMAAALFLAVLLIFCAGIVETINVH